MCFDGNSGRNVATGVAANTAFLAALTLFLLVAWLAGELPRLPADHAPVTVSVESIARPA